MPRATKVTEVSGDGVAVAVVKSKQPTQISIPRLKIAELQVRVVGVTSLICHRFPAKLRMQMKEERLVDHDVAEKKNRGRASKPKRDFEAEYHDSLYSTDIEGKYGFPAIAFKRAIVGACRLTSSLRMTNASQIIHVLADCCHNGDDLVYIDGVPRLREDVVRLSATIGKKVGNPDIRIRGEFDPWAVTLRIQYFTGQISVDGLVNLLNHAGFAEGIGEQRPSAPNKTGNNGRFRVDTATEIHIREVDAWEH